MNPPGYAGVYGCYCAKHQAPCPLTRMDHISGLRGSPRNAPLARTSVPPAAPMAEHRTFCGDPFPF